MSVVLTFLHPPSYIFFKSPHPSSLEPVIGVKACGVVGNVITSPLSGAYPYAVLLTPLLVEERNSIPTKALIRFSLLKALLNCSLFWML